MAAEWETVPLFDEPPKASGRERQRRAASVAWGNCPGCVRGQTKPIGLVRVGEYLAWREHTYRTWGGQTMVCPASGVTACQLRERQPTVLPGQPATCPHERDTNRRTAA